MVLTGNYSFKTINLVGDTEFRDANLTLARVNRNGFTATFVNCNTAGLYLDGVKQDSFVWQRKEAWTTAKDMFNALRPGGDEAWTAYKTAVQIIKNGSASMTWIAFQTAYAAAAPTNLTYSTNLFEKIKAVAAPGATWAQVRDFIRAHSFARLTGEETEVLEKVS